MGLVLLGAMAAAFLPYSQGEKLPLWRYRMGFLCFSPICRTFSVAIP